MGKMTKLVQLTVCPNKTCPILGICMRLNTLENSRNRHLSPQINQAIGLLGKNYQDSKYLIINLAKDMEISTRHLERLFHEELGCNPNLCLRQFRLNKFVELIYKENYSIKQAWIEAGFNSWECFEHMRRKRIKMSIKDVR